MLVSRSDAELAEWTADDVDIDSVTLAARCQQTMTQRPLSTLVSQRRTAAAPPRRYGAQRHIATRLLHHCLPATINNCTSFPAVFVVVVCYSVLVGKQSIAINLSVCVCVCQ